MTKGDLSLFLEPFTDDMKLINARGEDITATYIMNSNGEGLTVLVSVEERDAVGRVVREPMRHKN